MRHSPCWWRLEGGEGSDGWDEVILRDQVVRPSGGGLRRPARDEAPCRSTAPDGRARQQRVRRGLGGRRARRLHAFGVRAVRVPDARRRTTRELGA
jgi:hypothetical protein